MSKLCRAQNNLEIMGCYKETKMLSEAQVQGWSESSSIPSHFRWAVPLTKLWIHAPGFTEHPGVHRTSPSLALNLLADVVCTNQRRKREGQTHLMRASKSETILAIATTAPTHLHLQNNKLFHILQSQKPPPTAAAGVTHQTRASSVSLFASAIPTGRKETESLLFMNASGKGLAPGIPVAQRPFGQHKRHDRRRQRKTDKREKPLPKGFNRISTISLSLYKLSPSTVKANKPSSWGKAWRGEESTWKPNQKLCYDFFRANPPGIQQQIPSDVFLTLHITPYALFLSVSLSRKSRRTAKSTKEPKKRKRKGNK